MFCCNSVLERTMIDEAKKWSRILKGLPESRHKGDFGYSTEMFHLRPEVITRAPIRNDRRYAVAVITCMILISLAYGLFYFGAVMRQFLIATLLTTER
jgi:hypothetical protein